jgi:hypothetical protein
MSRQARRVGHSRRNGDEPRPAVPASATGNARNDGVGGSSPPVGFRRGTARRVRPVPRPHPSGWESPSTRLGRFARCASKRLREGGKPSSKPTPTDPAAPLARRWRTSSSPGLRPRSGRKLRRHRRSVPRPAVRFPTGARCPTHAAGHASADAAGRRAPPPLTRVCPGMRPRGLGCPSRGRIQRVRLCRLGIGVTRRRRKAGSSLCTESGYSSRDAEAGHEGRIVERCDERRGGPHEHVIRRPGFVGKRVAEETESRTDQDDDDPQDPADHRNQRLETSRPARTRRVGVGHRHMIVASGLSADTQFRSHLMEHPVPRAGAEH